ncbi:unnamed protein product [Prunus armeniaca]|uniref:Uncharacterized protein n=1 Tax=Prunus armeniaca TaxID=36596 RepID=A0A6J5V2K4_PRUAR|nr:unnamed protein product [Prunus armeniaca]CAB4312853.1 unnamed protein product [Prunus armeniaca]
MLPSGSSTAATQEASWLCIFSFADSYHLRGPPYCQLSTLRHLFVFQFADLEFRCAEGGLGTKQLGF